MTESRPAPTCDIDPFSHDVLRDPHPLEETLRAAGRAVYLTTHDVYAVARYDDVYAVLRDWQTFQSGAGVGLSNFRKERQWRPMSPLLEGDPPHHDAPRRVLAELLAPRTQRALRERWRADAQRLVDDVLARGRRTGDVVEFDAVADVAEAFPLRAFPDAVGVSEHGREHLVPFSDFLLNAFGPRNDLVRAGAPEAKDHTAWVVANCARDALADDGIGAQIWAAADRGEITEEQAPLVVRSLFAAGVNTTINALGATLYALATHPEQWRQLRARPALARVAFDEAVRWASPVQTFFRTTTADTRIGDVPIRDGEKVMLFLGAANRDPRRWPEPDVFDVTRDPSGHVGFGFGLHQCVGQHLARLEAESLITALVQRVATFEIAGEPRRRLNNTLRAWDAIPIRARLTAASGTARAA